ncbi:hypothetical protein [Flectobacillus major]|jgi:hypothetical protein|uniref:hypothetical protein n=1 Tax=Flectobacillus major TaxID=103 RepID=UPI0005C5B3F2|nr:hypothetical protein [Flectobacillus major]
MKKLFLFLAILSLASCQKNVYLTGSMMHTFQENELDLTRIQFYNDNPLVLERDVPSSDAKIKSGKVIVKNGRYINRISLEKNTPGLVQREEGGYLLITFEQTDGENWLRFGAVPGERGEYFYQIVDANGSPTFSRLDYEGNKYLVVYSNPRVRLMLSKSVLNNLRIKERKMKGVRVR